MASFPGQIIESSVYGLKTQVTIPEVVYEGEKGEICINLYDCDGNELIDDGMKVSVVISKDKGSCVQSLISCSLRENGTYSCKFQISSQGKYQVNICVFGWELDAEPLTIDVQSAPAMARAQVPVYDREENVHTQPITFDGIEAKILLFFYCDEVNAIANKKYPSVTVKMDYNHENPYVVIRYPVNRKDQFEEKHKRLQALIHEVPEYSVRFENEDRWREVVKKFKEKKSTKVLLVPMWEKRRILLFSNDEKSMDEAIKFMNGISEVQQTPVTSSREGRKFDKEIESKSTYKRHNSRENDNFNADQSASSSAVQPNIKFQFWTKEDLCVKLYKGSITKLNVDAIVNPTNENLKNVGGIAYTISKPAGRALEDGCKEEISRSKYGRIDVSQNCVTVSGKLPCRFVIHAVGPAWYDYKDKRLCLEDLSDTVLHILDESNKRKFKIVVMPPISSGIYSVPKTFCAAMYLKGIMEFSRRNFGKKNVLEFHIIDIKDEMLDLIQDTYQKWRKNPETIDPVKLLQGSKHDTAYPSQSHSREEKWEVVSYDKQKGSNTQRVYGDGQTNSKLTCHSEEIYENKEKSLTIFEFKGHLEVHIYSRNLVSLEVVDAIVSTENRTVSGTGGLAKALLNAGGKKYSEEHEKLLSGNKYMLQGNVLMTHAGKLPFRNIFHVVIEQFPSHIPPRPYDLKQQENAVRNVLEKANLIPLSKTDKKEKPNKKGGVSIIAMALFGSGNLTTPLYVEKHCESVYDAIADFAERHHHNSSLHLEEIHLVNMNQDITKTFQNVFRSKSSDPELQRYVDPPKA